MKVIVGGIYQEANTFNPFLMSKEEFVLVEGDDMLNRVESTEVFKEAGFEVVPSIYAFGLSAGKVEEEAYRYFADKILAVIKAEEDIDGVWLHLHGTMVVENIGSCELQLLKEIRAVIGEDIPISITLDPHGNNALELADYANIIRSYRTVPHVDQPDTERITAQILVKQINEKVKVHPAFIRLPMIIGGERALDDKEPLKSIFEKLAEVECIEGIATASFFIGFSWADTENTASSIIVVPESERFTQLAQEQAKVLADYVFSKRHEFKFESITLQPKEAVQQALDAKVSPVFISDSGDNTTGGAIGVNTELLDEFLNQQDYKGKRICVAAIFDEVAYEECARHEIGDDVRLNVGKGYDAFSKSLPINGILKAKGDLNGYLGCTTDKVGDVCTVSIGNVDLVIANKGDSFITLGHFNAAGLNVDDYDVIVVKQGYLFAELSAMSKLHILALTQGATYQLFEELPFKHIPRPIFPFEVTELSYQKN